MVDNIKGEIEDKIIDLIALGSGGRIVVFKPEKSLGRSQTGEADPLRREASKNLAIEKKGDYGKKVIFLNIYVAKGESFESDVQDLLNEKNLKPGDNFYLMFVHFNFVKQDIEDNFLIIPSLDLKKLDKANVLSKFLMNKKDFVRFLINIFDKK